MAYKKIILRRDTASNWTSANPTLSGGEVGIETDTLKMKLGNGSTAWTSLGYFAPPSIDEVGDVTITSASSGQFLKWNGTAWQVLNACASNSGLDAGGLTCYKLGL